MTNEEIYENMMGHKPNKEFGIKGSFSWDDIDALMNAVKNCSIPAVSDSFISKLQEIIYSDLSDSEIVNALHKLDSEHLVCPKCGNTGRCEPRTLSDPDGQECDCEEHLSLFPNGQYRCTKCWEWWHR